MTTLRVKVEALVPILRELERFAKGQLTKEMLDLGFEDNTPSFYSHGQKVFSKVWRTAENINEINVHFIWSVDEGNSIIVFEPYINTFGFDDKLSQTWSMKRRFILKNLTMGKIVDILSKVMIKAKYFITKAKTKVEGTSRISCKKDIMNLINEHFISELKSLGFRPTRDLFFRSFDSKNAIAFKKDPFYISIKLESLFDRKKPMTEVRFASYTKSDDVDVGIIRSKLSSIDLPFSEDSVPKLASFIATWLKHVRRMLKSSNKLKEAR